MYQCPNCGGNLKFHIPTQQLMCEYCQTQMDPYSFHKEKDAEERSEYEVTVFCCPQCGGEIISTDNTAAAFCSFCGASTILDSHINHEKRPRYILPFRKTKEDCKTAYTKMMKHAIFAPDDLKKDGYIDGFRGIYMPYWIYNISQKGDVTFPGEKTYRRGDYIYTDHFSLGCTVDATYNGLSYDASSSFADNISEAIAPYDVKEIKSFTPSFLSGFYADTADVEQNTFVYKAEDIANMETREKLEAVPAFRPYHLKADGLNTTTLHTTCDEINSAMFPVWFLSYRNGDRVAYATVNGQTGKVAADLPVDKRKYMIGSLLLAIPIFILLNLFFTFTPGKMLIASTICSIITAIISFTELSELSDRAELHTAGNKGKIPGYVFSLIAAAISILTLVLNPASDLLFYGAAVVSLIAVFGSILDIITKYNILSTRKLPQFNRQGGDDLA